MIKEEPGNGVRGELRRIADPPIWVVGNRTLYAQEVALLKHTNGEVEVEVEDIDQAGCTAAAVEAVAVALHSNTED